MCPKKPAKRKRTLKMLRNQSKLSALLECAKDAEKGSDKNTIKSASTVGKHGKENGSLKRKSEKQSERH